MNGISMEYGVFKYENIFVINATHDRTIYSRFVS